MTIWLVVIVVAVFLDQLTKYLTVLHLKPVDTLPIIEDVIHLTYVENTGAAFGMMKDARWIFMITSTLAIIGILVYLFWKRPESKLECLSLAFIVGGGIGNMIDRTTLGYVVDMIDCRFINFAVFNVADSFVCIGAGLMILYLFVEMGKEIKAEKAAKAMADKEGSDEGEEISTDETSAEDLTETAVEEPSEDRTEGADHE